MFQLVKPLSLTVLLVSALGHQSFSHIPAQCSGRVATGMDQLFQLCTQKDSFLQQP